MKQNTDSNYNFLLTGAATHVGQVRKANEDSMSIFEVANMKVFVVCDGMGGHVGGKVASETAIAAIREFMINNVTLDPREAIHNSINAANEAILRKAAQQPELAGMGSTCVMLVVTSDGRVYYGHIGDSRIYIVANHRITQLTKDHSFVQALVDAGQITKEQAEHHPRKNEITNALGLSSMQPPTLCNAPIEPDSGNCFLLCSDGLTGMVGDEQIQRVISKHENSIQQRAEKLVEMANANGGVDNITVELIEFALGTQQISGGGKKPKKWKKLLLYVLPVLVVLGGLAWYLEKTIQPKPEEENKKKEDIVQSEENKKNTEIVPVVPISDTTPLVEFPSKGKENIHDTIFINMNKEILLEYGKKSVGISLNEFKDIPIAEKTLWEKDKLQNKKVVPSYVTVNIDSKKKNTITVLWNDKTKEFPNKVVLTVAGEKVIYEITLHFIDKKPDKDSNEQREEPEKDTDKEGNNTQNPNP